MMVHVVPFERLLEHHQVKSIKFLQKFCICKTIGGISVGHQSGLRKLLSHRRDKSEILSRFYLDFDALIPVIQFFLNRGKELTRVPSDSQGNSAGNLWSRAAN